MYKNIRIGPVLCRIRRFSLGNDKHLTVPHVVLMDALRFLMENKVFQFGDTYWLQKLVTVMGAPPVPPWDTIFFGIPEEAVLTQFGDSLQLYCHFINIVLYNWLVKHNPAEDHRKCTAFKSLM